jgi:hypothetical protein
MANDKRAELKREMINYFSFGGLSDAKREKAFEAFLLCCNEGRMLEDFFSAARLADLEAFKTRYWDLNEKPLKTRRSMSNVQAKAVLADPTSGRDLIKEALSVLG